MIIYYIRKPSRNKNGWLIQSRVSEYNNVVITTVGSLINMAASSTGASWVSWSTVTWLEGVEHHQLPPATNTEVISSACAKWTLALALFQEISEAACLPMNFRRWLKKTTREWDGNMFFFSHEQLPIKPVDITVFWYSEMVRRWWRVSWLYRARCCSGLQCVKWIIDSDNWAVKTSIGLWNDLSPYDRFSSDFPHFSTSKSWRCFPLRFP